MSILHPSNRKLFGYGAVIGFVILSIALASAAGDHIALRVNVHDAGKR